MPSVALNGDVIVLENGSYDATDFRRLATRSGAATGEGVIDFSSFRVTPGSGLSVNISAGGAAVRQPGDGGLYQVSQEGSAANLPLTTAAPSGNPRIDQILVHVYDGAASGDTSNQFQALFETIDGSQSSGATLDNRNGAPDPNTAFGSAPAFFPIADVVVAAGATSLSGANIRDRRQFANLTLPPLATAGASAGNGLTDMVPLLPLGPVTRAQPVGADIATLQSAATFWLPRRIAATNIRWAYYNGDPGAGGANPISGNNWNLALVDSSGRLLAQTGAVAFAGGAGSIQHINQALSVPYAGYYFEPGPIIVWFGVSSIGSAAVCAYAATVAGTAGNLLNGWDVPAPNMFWYNSSGGTGFPSSNTILTMTDSGASGGAAGSKMLPVPMTCLTIG